MKRNDKNIFKLFLPLILASVFLPFTPAEGAMNSYCITPPFVSQSIAPNVLLILDNSGSMNCLAYQSSYVPSQFATGYYYGYFDPTKKYRYDTSVTPNRWIPTANAITTGTVANPVMSGNLLNWITMSRQDVAKKILIGGRASSGAYAAADRTTNPVKLYGNSDPSGSNTCATDHKSYDSQFGAYPNLSSFFGDYMYTVATGNANTFSVTFNDAPSFKLYPNSNFSSTNPAYAFPAAWAVTGAGSAYQVVDETTANTTDYIVNKSSTGAALFGYNHADATLLGSSGTIANVTVYAYAKRTGTSTVNLQGVLRLKDSSTDLESASGTSALSTSYALVSLGVFTMNPQTLAAWQWSDLIGTAANGSLLGFGVKASLSGAGNPTTSNYPTVSQVFIQINVSSPTAGGPYKIIVDQGATAASGLLDKMSAEVRFGLANYNSNAEGGKIVDYVDYGAISGIVSSINGMTGSGYTPLAETLYEAVRYFRQDSTYSSYSSSDYIKGCTGAGSGTYDCAGATAANKVPTSKDPFFYDFTDASIPDKYVPCAKSYVIFMTDGESTQDQTIPGSSTSTPYSACTLTNIKACSGYQLSNPRFAGTAVGQTYSSSGSDYIIDVAYWARSNDMRPGTETDIPTAWRQSLPGTQNIYLYPVYLFGSGSTLLKDASIYGAFNDLNGNNKPDCTTTPAECYRDTDGNGVISSDGTDDPITYYEGDDGYKLEASITAAIEDILKRVTSGTAASVLASGEGSGANLIQAVFYPLRKFSNGSSFDEINWTGRITNLWYYVDPLFTTSNIREEDGDGMLNLMATTSGSTHDYIVSLFFDKSSAKAKAHRWEDPNGNGVIGTQLLPDIEFEALGNLWEAGTMLWKRNVNVADAAGGKRKIYTTINGTSLLAGNFSSNAINPLPSAGTADVDNSAMLASYLSVTTAAPLIDWVQGVDVTGYRSRTVKVESIDSTARVWKLGDIVNSTPKISSWAPLNAYWKIYGDVTYSKDGELGDLPDDNHFTTTAAYKGRGMVFTGGNDGMLHAFKLGTLQLHWDGQGATEKARLLNPDTGDVCKAGDAVPCGKELWAFIPKNVLPYLQYMADPAYCHLYAVDLTPFIFDASIDGALGGPDDARTVSSWRTILIGGMRFGGACKNSTDTCTSTTCVKTPIPNVGYSSYFALDITDQNNPKLLWEFSNTELGFASTGPAVVRINGKTAGVPDKLKNGNWFVIFGSGPTGPISTSDHQFMGTSNQNLKLFILDLKTGNLLRTLDTGISNAFAGSLVGSTLDTDNTDYQDEVMYVPYIKKCTATTAAPLPFSSNNICTIDTWTNGGLGRLSTKRDSNPSNWTWSTFIDNIGPTSSAVTKIVDKTNSNLWIYFGTGRYYFTQSSADDAGGQRFLFGVKEPCFTSSGYDLTCTTAATLATSPFSGLTDVSDVANVPTNSVGNGSTVKGWYLALDPAATYTYAPDPATSFSAERMITDPLASLGQGIVYFTTYKPTNDICSFGGKSFIWALQYNTGGPPDLLSGKALIQVSTGAIEQKDLSTAFVNAGGRKSAAMEGKPPEAQGLSIIAGPPPTKKVIHIKER